MTFMKIADILIQLFKDDNREKGKSSKVLTARGDMSKIIRDFIIRPTIIIDNSLKENKYLSHVISYNVSFFAASYAKVFTALINIHGLKPDVAFDILSESTDYTEALEEGCIDLDKIMSDAEKETKEEFLIAGLEAYSYKGKDKNVEIGGKYIEPKEQHKIDEILKREIEVHIATKVNGKDTNAIIPVTILAKIIFTDVKGIMVSGAKEDSQNPFDRIDDLRAGSIKFWEDFIFAKDMIQDYGKRKLDDKNGVLSDKRKREYHAFIKGFDRGYVGFGRFYRMVIGSEKVKDVLEKRYRSRLDKVVEKVQDNFSLFSLSIMDTMYDRLTLYNGALDGGIDLRLKDIKKKSKSEDMEEILTMILGSTRTGERSI